MMQDKQYRGLVSAILEYRQRLNTYTDVEFLRKANADTWSAAEVYAHIISANRMTVRGMHKAAEGNATEDSSNLPWKARFILFFEKFPKGRKVPEVVQKRTPAINTIAEAIESTESLMKELDELMATYTKWTKTQKLKHPALGMLNNYQWLKFMKIHSKHHLKQLDRIKNL